MILILNFFIVILKMHRAYFEDGAFKVFHQEGNQSLRIRLIFKDGDPKIGISEFYLWQGMWRPGQRHFFLSPSQWKNLSSQIEDFNVIVEKGKVEDSS